MRSFIAAAAAGTAFLAGTVRADLCSEGSAEIAGNWYCQAVNSIQYQNFDATGSYQQVTNMDTSTGTCSFNSVGTRGSMSPLQHDVSLHLRGPLQLSQFAYYSTGKGKAAKRAEHFKRHGHQHFHAHEARENESDEQKKRGVGSWVVQTMNGEVVSWKNEYTGGAPAAPTPAAAADGIAGAVGSIVGGAAAAVTDAAQTAAKPFVPSYSGDWVREAHYDAAAGKSEGVTFLNYFGGQPGSSGVWDEQFGSSLSYAASSGIEGATTPQVLANTQIPSGSEVIMMSDRPCAGSEGCHYYRPGTEAFYGFENRNAVYLFEFSMPQNSSTAATAPYDAPINMPAIWMLNAQIPRTIQYGSCSCWPSCGEFDIVEVLTPGETRCKSTLHGIISGGDSDYIDRPQNGAMKMALVMSDSTATIQVLPDTFDFSKTLTNEAVNQLGNHKTGGLLQQLGSSLFDLATQGTS